MNYYQIAIALALIFVLSLQKCYSQNNSAPILDSIINEVKNKSIFKDNVNWKDLTPRLYKAIDTTASDSISEIIPAIQKLYTEIGDSHGTFLYKDKTTKGLKNSETEIDTNLYRYAFDEQYAFRTKIICEKYGYLAIPSPQIPKDAFNDKETAYGLISQMSQQIQDSLYKMSSVDLKGIIIDLRLSMGGATPILLSSLSPLLGDGIAFSVTKEDSSSIIYNIEGGNLFEGDEIISRTTAIEHPNKNTKVAILIGPLTSSAAEQTAVAFNGKDNVKFIGEQTAGYLTMTSLIRFNDDLIFTYSSGYVKDRNNKLFKNYFNPDLPIKGGDNFEILENDAKIKTAIKWITNN